MLRRRRAELREYIRLAAPVIGRGVLLSPPLPENIINDLSDGFKDRTKYARWLATFAAKSYGLPTLPLYVLFEKLDNEKAGSISYRNSAWYLCVDEKYQYDDVKVISIVAHEMAHVLLAHRGLKIEPAIKNEELTDTVSVLAGYGRSIHSACLKERVNPLLLFVGVLSVKREKLGYLSKDEFAFILRLKNLIASQDPIERWCPIDPKKTKYILCYSCGTKLGLQAREGTFDVKCPICLLRQNIKQVFTENHNIHAYIAPWGFILRFMYRVADYLRGFD